jgi:dihydrodipicolinate synthase/N-acetylneuraminate lyase
MVHAELTGILVALVTPFTADASEVDVAALERHVNRLIACGVHGLIVGGSTGEFTALTLNERKQLTELRVTAAAGRVPVIAGTGALTSRETVQLSQHAAEADASAN